MHYTVFKLYPIELYFILCWNTLQCLSQYTVFEANYKMSSGTFWITLAGMALLAAPPVASDEAPYPAQQESNTSNNAVRSPSYPWPTSAQTSHVQPSEDGYRVQTGYEGYLVPSYVGYPNGPGYPTELVPALLGGVGVVWAAVAWLVSHAVAIGLGVVLALGVCKLTPLCSVGWLGSHVEELRGFASSARLSRAADMLTLALKKYGNQGDDEVKPAGDDNKIDTKNDDAKAKDDKTE